jgi:DNA-binding NarL/FixJ family response regulator
VHSSELFRMTNIDKPYNVLLADDHPVFRNGFVLILKKHLKVNQVYHAADGFEALKILHHHPVDLVFLDYYMPFMNGEECMKVMKLQFPQIKVIVISMMNSPLDIITMRNAGAHGFIIKNFNGEELGIAVKTVMQGRKYYDSYISAMLIEDKNSTAAEPEAEYSIKSLTPREKQILKMITHGEISKEIAEKVRTSQETVEKQRKNILKKINGRGIADAIRYSLKNGIVNVNEFLHGEEYRKKTNGAFASDENKDKDFR